MYNVRNSSAYLSVQIYDTYNKFILATDINCNYYVQRIVCQLLIMPTTVSTIYVTALPFILILLLLLSHDKIQKSNLVQH